MRRDFFGAGLESASGKGVGSCGDFGDGFVRRIMRGRRGWRDGGTERRRVRGRIGWYLSVARLLLLSVDGVRSPAYGLVQTAITDRGFGPVAGGGELGGVEGGLVEFGGELFVSKGLGGS